ncbi:MAG: T9SS type A sorting domain-containing protein [Aureispira sp.]|nr:T9SS type A sorting domain-containing protein [Aureispira sp.]
MTISKLIKIVFLLTALMCSITLVQGQSSLIKGHVYQEIDTNCQKDFWETTTLSNVIIKAEKGSWVNYTTTDVSGYYELPVDTGTYYVSMIPPSPYWLACNDSAIVSFSTAGTTTHNLGSWAYTCPLLHVGVSTPVLQPCQPSTYTVSYCNIGTGNAAGAYVDVQLDSFLTLDSASAPLLGQLGYKLYRFDVGNVPFNTCGNFDVHTTLDCGTILTGQTHCVSAHIFPDTLCIPGTNAIWDQSDIKITVECNIDSIKFHLENIGTGNMSTQRAYFVAEDEIMLKTGTYQLNSGQIETLAVPVNGLTYHMQAQQDPAHPLRPFVSVGFEGCGAVADTTGILLQYPLENYLPAFDYDCQQNLSQLPETSTTGYPIGYGSNHYIPSTQPLEYHIQFQNRGLGISNNVLIVDTLSEHLDISSLQIMSCSHDYTWTLEDNVLKIQFNNILLPTYTIDNHKSQGFARFYILQKPGNIDGTIIENNAQVYFDGQGQTTNTTTHEIKGDAYTSIITHTVFEKTIEQASIQIFPNPVHRQATVRIEPKEPANSILFRLWNSQGQLVYSKASQTSQFEIYPNSLTSGVYFYTIEIDGKPAQTGQLIAK